MTERTANACPMANEHESQHENLTRHQIVEQAAQDLLLDPGGTTTITRKLISDLQAHYALMLEKDPIRAEFNITRYTRTAVHGAFMHLAGDRLINLILPHIRSGESLIPEELPSDVNYLCRTFHLPFTEPYHSFMNAGTYWWHKAIQQSLQEVAETPNHPYSLLYHTARSTHSAHRKKQQEHTPGRVNVEDINDWRLTGGVENVFEAMLLMIAKNQTGKNIGSEEMTRRTLGDVAVMALLANISKGTRDKVLPIDKIFDPRNDTVIGHEAFTTCQNVFVPDSERAVFRHKLLRQGTYKEPHSCVGRLPLLSADPASQTNAQELFKIAEERSGVAIRTPNNGTFSNVELLIILGAYIGEDTIFAR